jgi:hypothetical protein
MKVLGHPLGSEAYSRAFFIRKAKKSAAVIDDICKLTDYQNKLSLQSVNLLLRYCAEPRIAHLLRCAHPDWIAEAAGLHDRAMKKGLNRLLGPGDLLCDNVTSCHDTWKRSLHAYGHAVPCKEVLSEVGRLACEQASLPLRRGGMGYVSASAISPSSLLGGMASTARFLAQDKVAEPVADGGYGFPTSGADFTRSLTTDEYPHCQATRTAWSDVENELLANASTGGADITTLMGCNHLSRIHASHKKCQSQLSRALGDGRARRLENDLMDFRLPS